MTVYCHVMLRSVAVFAVLGGTVGAAGIWLRTRQLGSALRMGISAGTVLGAPGGAAMTYAKLNSEGWNRDKIEDRALRLSFNASQTRVDEITGPSVLVGATLGTVSGAGLIFGAGAGIALAFIVGMTEHSTKTRIVPWPPSKGDRA